jgi:hypothetical protein
MVDAQRQGSGHGPANAGLHRPSSREGPVAQARMASRTCFLVGAWLAISPWALGYGIAGQAVANALIAGSAIALLALIRSVRAPQLERLSWVNFLLGLWLVVSPFVLPYPELTDLKALTVNNIIVGLFVFSLAGASASITGRMQDGKPTPR